MEEGSEKVPVNLRPSMPQNFTWYSICSGHSCNKPEHGHDGDNRYCPDCPRCNVGRWVNDEYQELNHWLYAKSYKLWYEWSNRESHPGEPGHEARTFLERVFPGLRKKTTP